MGACAKLIRWSRGLLVSALLFGPGLALGQTLTPDELRGLAVSALDAGDPQVAEEAAKALLNRDISDISARLILAEAHMAQGDWSLGRAEAARAWREAQSDQARYVAARLLSIGNAQEGQDLRAQFWLRRAVQSAPTEDARTVAVENFRAVRRQSPWRTQLSFGLTPLDNINNAPQDASVQFGGLNFLVTPPLSGLEGSLGFAAQYRLSQSRAHQTWLTGQVYHRRYWFSDEAKEIVDPDGDGLAITEAGDFELSFVELGWRHMARVEGGRLTLQVKLSETHFGQDPLRRGLSVSADMARRPVEGWQLSYGASLSHGRGLSDQPDVDSATLRFGLARANQSGILRLSSTFQVSESTAASSDFRGLSLKAAYDLRQPLMGMDLSFDVGISSRLFPIASTLEPVERDDRTLSLSATAAFRDIEYLGFIPTLTARYEQTWSSVDRFDVESFRLEAGFRSSF